jgi:hypothetical protein
MERLADLRAVSHCPQVSQANRNGQLSVCCRLPNQRIEVGAL